MAGVPDARPRYIKASDLTYYRADCFTQEETLPADIAGIRAVSTEALATRWSPVDILCEGEVRVRTKLVRSAEHAAVCVSEAVSHEVLQVVGLEVAPSHSVTISQEFARDLTRQYAFEPGVVAGRHWGTTLMATTALEVEFGREHVPLLQSPTHLVTLFLVDVVLANTDRSTHGNVLLAGALKEHEARLIPIDQSDCFNHPSTLRNPDELKTVRGERIAGWLEGTENVVLEPGVGVDFVKAEIARIQGLGDAIRQCVGKCPDEWYDRATVDPTTVRDFLEWRVQHLTELVDISYWENLQNAIGGGYVINL